MEQQSQSLSSSKQSHSSLNNSAMEGPNKLDMPAEPEKATVDESEEGHQSNISTEKDEGTKASVKDIPDADGKGSGELEHDESPSAESDSPHVEDEFPSAESDSPRVENESPSVESDSPRVEKEFPSAESDSPRVEKESPSAESDSPRVEKESSSAESDSPRVENESPSAESDSPRVEKESPSAESDSPRVEKESPSAESDSPRVENESPGEMLGKERNSMFEKAESHFNSSKLDMALECYLKCIKGIEQGSGFLYLPQCLHKIAECYHRKDEDEKAIQFLKAEKMYYETALIDTKLMQQKIEEIAADDNQPADSTEAEIARAIEYENLAKLCLDKHQSQLALEFSGKATKLYQKNYGDGHVATQRCLDLFTTVYAQVGKEEYSDKLSKYERDPIDPQHDDADEGNTRPRRRNKAASGEGEKVTTDSSTTTEETKLSTEEKELSWCCLTLLWIALVLCAIAATIMFSVVYCKVTPTSWACHWVRVQYRSFAEHIGFIAFKLGKRR